MALVTVTNTQLSDASQLNQYFNLLTGVMTDQVVTLANTAVIGAQNVGQNSLIVNGFSAAQTGSPLIVKQNPSGTALLNVFTVASAVNGFQLSASATANKPTLAVVGSDTNIGLNINGKGTLGVSMTAQTVTSVPLTLLGNSTSQTGSLLAVTQNPGGNQLLVIATVASAVNGFILQAQSTGKNAQILASGVDPNISLELWGQGTGVNNTATLTITDVNNAVNGVQITDSITGAGPIIAARGTDSNVSLNINPKGTGGVVVTAQSVTGVPLTVNGTSASQTGNLLVLNQNSGGNALLTVATVASAVNGFTLSAKATGGSPTIAASGTDSAIALVLQAKSTTNSLTLNDTLAAATNPLLVGIATDTAGAGVTDGFTGALRLTPTINGAFTVTRHNYIDLNNTAGAATVTDAAVFRFNAAAGTHKAFDGATTKTTPGTVNGWMKVNVNGTIFYIPAYTSKTS